MSIPALSHLSLYQPHAAIGKSCATHNVVALLSWFSISFLSQNVSMSVYNYLSYYDINYVVRQLNTLHSIELVAEYSTVSEGQGGYREDVQYYGIGAEI